MAAVKDGCIEGCQHSSVLFSVRDGQIYMTGAIFRPILTLTITLTLTLILITLTLTLTLILTITIHRARKIAWSRFNYPSLGTENIIYGHHKCPLPCFYYYPSTSFFHFQFSFSYPCCGYTLHMRAQRWTLLLWHLHPSKVVKMFVQIRRTVAYRHTSIVSVGHLKIISEQKVQDWKCRTNCQMENAGPKMQKWKPKHQLQAYGYST